MFEVVQKLASEWPLPVDVDPPVDCFSGTFENLLVTFRNCHARRFRLHSATF